MSDVGGSRMTLNNQLWPAFCPVSTHAVYEWTAQAPTRRSRPTDRRGFLLADSFLSPTRYGRLHTAWHRWI